MQSKCRMQSVTILHNLSDIPSRSKSYHPREVMSCLLWELRIVQRQMRHKFMSINYMYCIWHAVQVLVWKKQLQHTLLDSQITRTLSLSQGEKLLCVDDRILHFTYEGEQ
ncbi:hypothetical protein BT93_C1170 [Corymbia citriodora subsp. variegata]|nr:hypothetical protein BT93_C1170 [Corymbia citriodora subsp. variegata]